MSPASSRTKAINPFVFENMITFSIWGVSHAKLQIPSVCAEKPFGCASKKTGE